MKKVTYFIIAVVLIVIIVLAIFVGIYITTPTESTSSSKLKVLATFYPIYDFAQNVGGDKVNCFPTCT